jgi:hypothetical protein
MPPLVTAWYIFEVMGSSPTSLITFRCLPLEDLTALVISLDVHHSIMKLADRALLTPYNKLFFVTTVI